MSTKEDLEKAGSLIPEFYFDLIARILPGFIFIYAMIFAFTGRYTAPMSFSDSLVALVASYTSGFALDKSFGLLLSVFKITPPLRKVFDGVLDLRNSRFSNIILKMCAEATLLHSLFLTALALAVVSIAASRGLAPPLMAKYWPLMMIACFWLFGLCKAADTGAAARLDLCRRIVNSCEDLNALL